MNEIHRHSRKKQRNRGDPPNFSGQHFIHHKKLLRDIVDHAKISAGDTVLEIGAGKGALTTLLTQKAGKVLAVEYDARLVEILRRKTAQQTNIKIIQRDIMKLRLPKEKFMVVSNIPYAITTPIMKLLLNNPSSPFQGGVIIMEKGAAKRFTSKSIKNAFVLAWRMWFDIRYVQGISRDHFSPPPRVDSAMVAITRKTKPRVANKDFFKFLSLAQFALREPDATIDTALKGMFTPPQIKHLKRNLGLQTETSIGRLSESQWEDVFKTMLKHVPPHLWPRSKRKELERI